MATNVRNRSVGMLILSLGPTIFAPTILSRTGSETVALSPWRRRVLRMRFRSHILALSHFRTENRIPPPPEFIIGPAYGRTRWRGRAFPENALLGLKAGGAGRQRPPPGCASS